MVRYMKCPRCELNYIDAEKQTYCDICQKEMKGIILDIDEEDAEELATELCPVCNENFMRAGEKMCDECRKKADDLDETTDEEEDDEWREYLDDDTDDDMDDEIDESLKEEFDEGDLEEEEEEEYESEEEEDLEYVTGDEIYTLSEGDDDEEDEDDEDF